MKKESGKQALNELIERIEAQPDWKIEMKFGSE